MRLPTTVPRTAPRELELSSLDSQEPCHESVFKPVECGVSTVGTGVFLGVRFYLCMFIVVFALIAIARGTVERIVLYLVNSECHYLGSGLGLIRVSTAGIVAGKSLNGAQCLAMMRPARRL